MLRSNLTHVHRSGLFTLMVGMMLLTGSLTLFTQGVRAQQAPGGLPTAAEISASSPRDGTIEYTFGWYCSDFISCDGNVFHNLVDIYPAAGGTVSYVSATPQQGTCTLDDADSVSCDLSPFNGDQTIIITFVVNYTSGVDMFQHNALNVAVEIARRIAIINPVGTEVLTDGGVESAPLNPAWVKQTGAKQKCNANGTVYAFEGSCAFMVKPGGVVTQTQALTGWVLEDAIWFEFYAQTKSVNAKPVVMVTIQYTDNTSRKLKIKLPVGSAAYTSFTDQVTLFGTVDEIKLKASYNGTVGKVLLDSFSVVLVDQDIFTD